MKPSQAKGYLFVIASAVIYGCMPLMASAIYANGVNSVTLVFLRNILSLPALGILARMQNKSMAIPKKALPSIGLVALSGCCITPLLLFSAYKHIASGTATVLHFIYPAAVVVAGVVFLHQKAGTKNIVSVALCIGGLCMFYTPGQSLNPLGSALALMSGLTFAGYILLLSNFKYKQVSGFLLNFYIASVSSVFMLIVCLATNSLALPQSIGAWALCLFFATIVTAGASVLFQQGTFIVGGEKASVLSALEPITGVVVGALFLNETVTLRAAIGSALIIAASILISLKEKTNEKAKGDL